MSFVKVRHFYFHTLKWHTCFTQVDVGQNTSLDLGHFTMEVVTNNHMKEVYIILIGFSTFMTLCHANLSKHQCLALKQWLTSKLVLKTVILVNSFCPYSVTAWIVLGLCKDFQCHLFKI